MSPRILYICANFKNKSILFTSKLLSLRTKMYFKKKKSKPSPLLDILKYMAWALAHREIKE